MQINEGPVTVVAGEALEACRRVKIMPGTTTIPPQVVYADEEDVGIGITSAPAAVGEVVAVLPYSGKTECVSSAAFAVGDKLYASDDGKVSNSDNAGSAVAISAVAWETASADGEITQVYFH